MVTRIMVHISQRNGQCLPRSLARDDLVADHKSEVETHSPIMRLAKVAESKKGHAWCPCTRRHTTTGYLQIMMSTVQRGSKSLLLGGMLLKIRDKGSTSP